MSGTASAGAGTVGLLIEPDGSVSLLGQRSDLGVISETAYCQIAAEDADRPRAEVEQWRSKYS
jgi:CO/xanthine dehydrogenase Mo-binding subunit